MICLQTAVEPTAVTRSHKDFLDSVHGLSSADMGRLRNLSFRNSGFQQEVKEFSKFARPAAETTHEFELLAFRAFGAYSIPFAAEEASQTHRLFGQLCFLNHSCTPNATLNWNDETGEMDLRAMKMIEVGKEILVSYMPDPIKARTERHRELGFECKCIICSHANQQGIEEAYLDLRTSLAFLDDLRTRCLGPPLSDDWWQVDVGRITEIARFLGKEGIQPVAKGVRIRMKQLGIAHIRLAKVEEIDSAASIAWYLTHRTDKDSNSVVHAAVEAKTREMGVLCFTLDIESVRARKAMEQLWCLIRPFEGALERFYNAVRRAGLEAEVHDGGL